MICIKNLAFCLSLIAAPASAQTFKTVPSLGAATTPLAGAEELYCVQGITGNDSDNHKCYAADIGNTPIIRKWGYIADGASHPLSSITNFQGANTTGFTLLQWQALLPSATALSNEIDGEAVRSYIAAASGPVRLYLPTGSAKFSNPIASCAQSVSLWGAGLNQTILNFVNATDGWDHCPSAPTDTGIEAHDLQFATTWTHGNTNYAVNANFSAPLNHNVNFDDVYFFGFNSCLFFNNTATSIIRRAFCTVLGTVGDSTVGNGIEFDGMNSFINHIYDSGVFGYNIGYKAFSTGGVGVLGDEDFIVSNSFAGNVAQCAYISAAYSGYSPAMAGVFDNFDCDSYVNWVNVDQAWSVIIRGGFYVIEASSGSWSAATSDLIRLRRALTVHIEDALFTNNAKAFTINSYINVLGSFPASDIKIANNTFEYNSLTTTQAMIAAAPAAVGVVVRDNTFTNLFAVTTPPSNAFSWGPTDARSALYYGQPGELILASASGVSLSNSASKTITSAVLTPGNWDCSGFIQFVSSGGYPTFLAGAVGIAANTIGPNYDNLNPSNIINQVYSIDPHLAPFGPTIPTTVYLVGQANFASGTQTGSGTLTCRRWR